MKPLPLVDGALFLDASTLTRYLACPRSFEYYKLEARESAGDSDALLFGQLVHSCLHKHYLDDFYNINDFINAFYAEHPNLGEGNHRTADFAMRLIHQYRTTYQLEPFDIVRQGTLSLIELPFAVPLGSITLPDGTSIVIVWTGRVDLVTHWPQDNAIYVVDHKTSSMEGDTFWASFHLDQAQQGYCWAVQEVLGKPVAGFMINALICTRAGNIKLARNKYWLDQETLAEWRHNTLQVVENLIADHQRGYFAMHKTACVGRFGRCEYHPVCTCAPSARHLQLHTNQYQDVTWSPLIKP